MLLKCEDGQTEWYYNNEDNDDDDDYDDDGDDDNDDKIKRLEATTCCVCQARSHFEGPEPLIK